MTHLKNAKWFIAESIKYNDPVGFIEHVLFYVELPIRMFQFVWVMRNAKD